ncbi:PQQ-dependent catabolism-associated CXXCW motif protein/quinoprotein dehydrogenase-associated probable ABC transporter substrate-binding protein [Arboricoccus pini]|uniref:PQQ-dependent catabolism-associated CXXCW motif protein/quinoprotein dehydrogenase-associated probable ABC transporter substrate-binding protein n=1 Tax=Arboricoccus pini TaxID=1963835 RepID=A0A212RZZ6_9PROT|nr:quinoprotein dehydrogenase-associated putative ABC transporter substrate-binding protein [Arboricoccus pini]SNB78428.1 PQQ-dependent catabolism-associated CXXCW motif protein/quinoprotein dehydrogenase-associated probable ABC transporter substrate-binding protein [Arboricoccus pini]
MTRLTARFSRARALCSSTALAAVLCTTGLVVLIASPVRAQTAMGELVDRSAFRVCADPSYLPFSDDQDGGFENKLADLFAHELGVPVAYTWYPRSQGFTRVTLRSRNCDVVMGVVSGDDQMQSTNPYYRTTYVLVYRQGEEARFGSMDAPGMATGKIGYVAGTPPSNLLLKRGLLAHATSYALLVDTRVDNPGRDMVADLAAGKIDVALLWGPIAGYWAKQSKVPLALTPIPSDPRAGERMDYRIALGIRRNEPTWKHDLERLLRRLQPQITAILTDYGVPLLDAQGNLIDPKSVPPVAAKPAEMAAAEPEGYRDENYRAPVPATLKGATVLDVRGLSELMEKERPVLVDVLPRQPKPKDRSPDQVWVEPKREDIPGSYWLPNTGFGFLPKATKDYFAEALATLTKGDKTTPLVFYCDPNCWMSWNAAKRALSEFGYQRVYWFPGGAQGWKDGGNDLANATIFEAAGQGAQN